MVSRWGFEFEIEFLLEFGKFSERLESGLHLGLFKIFSTVYLG